MPRYLWNKAIWKCASSAPFSVSQDPTLAHRCYIQAITISPSLLAVLCCSPLWSWMLAQEGHAALLVIV